VKETKMQVLKPEYIGLVIEVAKGRRELGERRAPFKILVDFSTRLWQSMDRV